MRVLKGSQIMLLGQPPSPVVAAWLETGIVSAVKEGGQRLCVNLRNEDMALHVAPLSL